MLLLPLLLDLDLHRALGVVDLLGSLLWHLGWGLLGTALLLRWHLHHLGLRRGRHRLLWEGCLLHSRRRRRRPATWVLSRLRRLTRERPCHENALARGRGGRWSMGYGRAACCDWGPCGWVGLARSRWSHSSGWWGSCVGGCCGPSLVQLLQEAKAGGTARGIGGCSR